MNAIDMQPGAGGVNPAGEVMVFVFPGCGDFTGFSSEGNVITLHGDAPLARRYEAVVSNAVAKVSAIQLAVVEEDGAVLSITDLPRV